MKTDLTRKIKLNKKQLAGLSIGWKMCANPKTHPCLGKHWKKTEEQKQNISRAKKGVPLTLEHRAALSLAKKGKPVPHLHKAEVHQKISVTLKGVPQLDRRDDGHWTWKADKASYTAFHQWLRRRYGRADRCEHPGCVYPRVNANGKILRAPSMFHWSLIHGYEHGHYRERYWRLCVSCHALYDRYLI